MWKMGLYRGVWRFASLPDLWNIVRSAIVGVLAISLALFLFNRLEGTSRTTLVLYPLILIVALGGPRVLFRLWKEHGFYPKSTDGAKRVVVLGAGRAGEMVARDMVRDRDYAPVGFLDDDVKLAGAKVHGLPVFGAIKLIDSLVQEYELDLIIIAMPSLSRARIRTVIEACERAGVEFLTLPCLDDVIAGRSAMTALREVAIDDLLGRDPIALDWQKISNDLAGKVVLISGGGGSIGSELCRQVSRFGPSKLIILEQSEFNLYSIEMELRAEFPSLELMSALIDVCDEIAVDKLLEEHRPNVIFHAAAYKHVPMLEGQARQAVKNNVLGTRTLALVADKYNCHTFVLVSTDKAVNPSNVMGATKRVAEILCQTLNRRSNTHFITVRFGNVLGSAGSVVPLFSKQIQSGGPVTVTHPDITRYFMTIPEASQLIMQASVLGSGGEIFVLDMGEPIKINYLAEQMIHLSGKTPGIDVEIKYTGLRPGEKLYEELFHDQEVLVKTEHEKIFLANCRCVDWNMVESVLNDMMLACDTCDNDALLILLKRLVPEMRRSGKDNNNIIPFERVTA